MRNGRLAVCAAILFGHAQLTALAHEFDELKISKLVRESISIRLLIDNTVQGHSITCAVYDADNEIVEMENAYTSNLATQVIMFMERDDMDRIETSKCVFD